MELTLEIAILILGMCFGSFVNMWEYRLAVKYGHIKRLKNGSINVNKNRSFCDGCGKQLKWYENIPIFSWLIQKGKTKCCHKRLPVSYPVVELISGLLFLIFFLIIKDNYLVISSPLFVFNLLIGWLMLVFLMLSTVFDCKYMELPDFSTIFMCLGAIAYNHFNSVLSWQNLVAALGASGFLFLLYVLTKGKGMGFGDVKLVIFTGLLLGGAKSILAFYMAFISGAIIGIVLIIFKKAKRDSAVPFGPYLIFGTLMAWWCGDLMLNLIYKWF